MACARVCVGLLWNACGCAQGYAGMHWCARVWDEFSEYLLGTRVLTPAAFNTYSVQNLLLKYLFINKVVEGSNYKIILMEF